MAMDRLETPDRPLETAGLSLLAFLSSGNTADGGKYAATVRRATEFLLRQTPADRYFGGVDGSQMRGQAIVTLALAQAYGLSPTRRRARASARSSKMPLPSSSQRRMLKSLLTMMVAGASIKSRATAM